MSESEKELIKEITPFKFCLHCVYRKSLLASKHSNRKRVYCEKQPSSKSSCGYKTIKAHDYACGLYKQKR